MSTVDTQRYGQRDSQWLLNQIDNWWTDNDPTNNVYECVDNERLAREGVVDDELAYYAQRDNGCCGAVDVLFAPSPDGHAYLYGFNHGH